MPIWTPNLGAIPTGEYLDDENLTRTKEVAQIQHRMYAVSYTHRDVYKRQQESSGERSKAEHSPEIPISMAMARISRLSLLRVGVMSRESR